MSLIISLFGILTAGFLTITFWLSTRVFTLGAMSLPAMLMVCSLIYFYLMPAFAFADGSAEHFGMQIRSLEWICFAIRPYAAGAFSAPDW